MPNHLKDLTGRNFGRLTVVRREGLRGAHTYWICICECSPDREVAIRSDVILRGRGIRNCGCWKREKAAQLVRKPDDSIGYAAAHSRVRTARGNASTHECVSCGGPAAHWALRKEARSKGREDFGTHKGHPFSPDPNDYQPMCRSCHGVYDLDAPSLPRNVVVSGIRQMILNGELPVGSALPKIADLADTFGVCTDTVRRAMERLIASGVVIGLARQRLVVDPVSWLGL